jgi:hypothetical protein
MNTLEPDRCIECRREFSADALIPYGDHYVCVGCKEGFLDKLKVGVEPGGGAVSLRGPWRNGKYGIVFQRHHRLPERCIRCGGPGRYSKTIVLRSSRVRLLWQAGGAGELGAKCRVVIHYCERHRSFLLKNRLLLVFAIGVIATSCLITLYLESSWFFFCFFLAMCLIPFGVAVLISSRRLHCKRIDDQFIHAYGAGTAFLDSLPEWEIQSGGPPFA